MLVVIGLCYLIFQIIGRLGLALLPVRLILKLLRTF